MCALLLRLLQATWPQSLTVCGYLGKNLHCIMAVFRLRMWVGHCQGQTAISFAKAETQPSLRLCSQWIERIHLQQAPNHWTNKKRCVMEQAKWDGTQPHSGLGTCYSTPGEYCQGMEHRPSDDSFLWTTSRGIGALRLSRSLSIGIQTQRLPH